MDEREGTNIHNVKIVWCVVHTGNWASDIKYLGPIIPATGICSECREKIARTGREKFEKLQSITDKEHLCNLSKILNFNFWSGDERLYFFIFYIRAVVGKMEWMDWTESYSDHLNRLFDIVK